MPLRWGSCLREPEPPCPAGRSRSEPCTPGWLQGPRCRHLAGVRSWRGDVPGTRPDLTGPVRSPGCLPRRGVRAPGAGEWGGEVCICRDAQSGHRVCQSEGGGRLLVLPALAPPSSSVRDFLNCVEIHTMSPSSSFLSVQSSDIDCSHVVTWLLPSSSPEFLLSPNCVSFLPH